MSRLLNCGGFSTPVVIMFTHIVLYAFAYQLQQPVIPFIIKRLGTNTNIIKEYTMVMTLFSVFQVVGVTIAGPLIDSLGARAMSLVAICACIASYALTALSDSMTMLFLSRIPTFLQHGVLASRAFISACSAPSERASMMGYLGLAYGVGMVGPWVGGLIIERSGDVYLPSWIACGVSLVSLVLVAKLKEPSLEKPLQHIDVDENSLELNTFQTSTESLPGVDETAPILVKRVDVQAPAVFENAASEAVPLNSFSSLWHESTKNLRWSLIQSLLRHNGVPSLIIVKTVHNISTSIFMAVLPIAFIECFHETSASLGFAMSFAGILYGISQGGTAFISSRFPESSINLTCIAIVTASFVVLMFTESMRWLFYLALAPKIAASAIYHTINIAQLTKQVDEHEYGSILGFEMVLASLARLVSIPLAGLFLQTFDWSGTCAICAILELIIVILMSLNLVFF